MDEKQNTLNTNTRPVNLGDLPERIRVAFEEYKHGKEFNPNEIRVEVIARTAFSDKPYQPDSALAAAARLIIGINSLNPDKDVEIHSTYIIDKPDKSIYRVY